jgi:hypothetical protein
MRNPFLAMFLGIVIGFFTIQFINEKLSEHTFWNCRDGKLVIVKHLFYGDTYYCKDK